jgi:hypothetical protein
MTWTCSVAQRRIIIAHRCERWAQQAERRGKQDRAVRLRELSAKTARAAYTIEELYRKVKLYREYVDRGPVGAA